MNDTICPHCGSTKDPWFDRTISIKPDGTERGMSYVCSDCGRDIDDKKVDEPEKLETIIFVVSPEDGSIILTALRRYEESAIDAALAQKISELCKRLEGE